ncbi:MAG: hypothetical protein M0042_14140 [Nitrospiraceae bacterium]|nr:hypothetical protein [Nitrospiraceae bacterium]
MRYAVTLVAVLIVMGFAGGVQASEKKTASEVARLAAEVQGKVVAKTAADVKVQARGCWLHIEFAANNAVFDLPLAGTKATETEMEDGIILENNHMTRQIGSRSPEIFERLILKFGRHNVKPVMETFGHAIKSCGDEDAATVALHASRY